VSGAAESDTLAPCRDFAGRAVAVVAAVAYSLAGGGCATDDGSSDAEKPPERTVREAARERVSEGIDRGFQTSDDQDSYRVRARSNVPRCDGPAFEIRVHGKWTRTWLEGPEEVGNELKTLREESEETEAGRFEISGEFSGEREAENGLSYPVFWATELESDS
jgi:hypothetical protein